MDYIDQILSSKDDNSRYETRLKLYPHDKSIIDDAVKEVEKRIKNQKKSFVIYGEPQCGKTELMIHICCKLFDLGIDMIVVLMHDIKALQMQNFNNRFAKEEHFRVKAMTENDFADIEDKDRHSKNGEKWLIVGRKNGSLLQKLIDNSRRIKNRVIIDDEADFATPNRNVQGTDKKLGDKASPINDYVKKLVGDGFWIGVTATPAKLDVNNTLGNEFQDSIIYRTGKDYTGQDYFFPKEPNKIKEEERYILRVIDDVEKASDKELINAVYRFLIRASYLNIVKDGNENYDPFHPTDPVEFEGKVDKYSMIIHSAVNMYIHEEDRKKVANIEANLRGDTENARKVLKEIELLIKKDKKIDTNLTNKILAFIWKERNQIKLYLFNSKKSIDQNIEALEPKFTFTFIFGAHCLSRGVTFENLLSMFFLRGAKIFQQGTYIQLARHFGYRKAFAKLFELVVPKENWEKWYKCFLNHDVMLEMLKNGTPIHLVEPKVKPFDTRSIDTKTVILSKGNTSFEFSIFNFSKNIEELFFKNDLDPIQKLQIFKNMFDDDRVFPSPILDKIIEASKAPNFRGVDLILGKNGLRDINNQKATTEEEKRLITRNRGLAPGSNEKNISNAFCWIVPYKNSITKKGRIIYVEDQKLDFYENTLNRSELVSPSTLKEFNKS